MSDVGVWAIVRHKPGTEPIPDPTGWKLDEPVLFSRKTYERMLTYPNITVEFIKDDDS